MYNLEFLNIANNILDFPYGVPIYKSVGKLKYEYRRIKIKNFPMFYIINKNGKRLLFLEFYIRKWI